MRRFGTIVAATNTCRTKRFPEFEGKTEMKAKKVLVVDDEYLIRWAMVHTLSDAGYDVTATDDGLKAIETAREEAFDFVITDLDLPGLGGWELLAMLCNLPVPPRVIITSACGGEDKVRKVKEKGGLAFVEKSSSLMDGIKETLREACGAAA
jgi:two-component system response regulator (stage 0 sporulation protein F)